MAKVGNEVKLILRLLEERTHSRIEDTMEQHSSQDYGRGFKHGAQWVLGEFANVCLELEGK